MVEIRKHGQGTHSTKMDADSPAENTPYGLKNFSQTTLPKSKSSRFLRKKKLSLGVYSPWTRKFRLSNAFKMVNKH